MRLTKGRRPHGVLFDITPMIDVVFQLIIFFMTCSQNPTSEADPIELPQLSGSVDKVERDLTVSVTADDRVLIEGAVVTPAEVEARTKQAAAKVGGGANLTVGLRVDRKAKSGVVNQVIAAIKRAGVPRGRIAVEPAAVGG